MTSVPGGSYRQEDCMGSKSRSKVRLSRMRQDKKRARDRRKADEIRAVRDRAGRRPPGPPPKAVEKVKAAPLVVVLKGKQPHWIDEDHWVCTCTWRPRHAGDKDDCGRCGSVRPSKAKSAEGERPRPATHASGMMTWHLVD